jgi:hypothetical protein
MHISLKIGQIAKMKNTSEGVFPGGKKGYICRILGRFAAGQRFLGSPSVKLADTSKETCEKIHNVYEFCSQGRILINGGTGHVTQARRERGAARW